MQRLEGLDSSFLYLDTPAAPMQVAMACVFDPHTVPGGYSFATVRRRVEERLHLVPPFRRRLVSVPGHVHRPVWIEDPDFDLDHHLRRAALRSPGGTAELEEFAAEVIRRPLERARPLWEMYVVEGLEGGMVGLVTKMHHATIDGVSGAELAATLLDLDPEPPPVPAPASGWAPERVPSRWTLLRDAGRDLIGQPAGAVSVLLRTTAAALRLARHGRHPDATPPPRPFAAPRTCCNGPLTSRRNVSFTQVDLDDVKQIKRATGTTVNDVVLALCAGALRSHLEDHDALPSRSLIAAVPVSVRAEDERAAMGNRLSAMLVDLATTIDDPLARLAAIAASAQAAKDQHDFLGHSTVAQLADLTPAAALAAIGAAESRLSVSGRVPPVCNLIVSNFPGPPFPLYLAGARMLAAYPLGPLGIGTGLNITVQSYLNTLWFSVVACPDLIPAPDELPDRLTDAFHELAKTTQSDMAELRAAYPAVTGPETSASTVAPARANPGPTVPTLTRVPVSRPRTSRPDSRRESPGLRPAATARTSVDERIARLSTASLRRIIEPDVDVTGHVGTGQVLPDELLSVTGLDLDLTPEQRRVLAREELASITAAGIRFEAVLTAGFSMDIVRRRDLTDPRVTYVLHELGEETRHSRLFIRMLDQLHPTARNPLDHPIARGAQQIALLVLMTMPAFFCVLVLTGEEIPDLLQKLAGEHPDTDPFIRDVNRYHRQEEMRHLAFARMILPELWQQAGWLERTVIHRLAPLIVSATFDTLIHPGVYAVIGLPAWKTWWAANRTPQRQAIKHQALGPLLRALIDAGALTPGRIPTGWQQTCGVDATGARRP